jgi:PLP dependent protein
MTSPSQPPAPSIRSRLDATRARILACHQAKTSRAVAASPCPQLIAVSKWQPTHALVAAAEAGQVHFGENYAQELIEKATQLEALNLCWHFLGPLQSNKAAGVARHASFVHSLDRLKIAELLALKRPAQLAPLNVFIQVNLDQSATKSGVVPADLGALIDAVKKLPRLALRGLMTLPDSGNSSRAFAELAQLAAHYGLAELSMGMSQDMEEAIAAGSTWLRIGTAIFGERPPHTR